MAKLDVDTVTVMPGADASSQDGTGLLDAMLKEMVRSQDSVRLSDAYMVVYGKVLGFDAEAVAIQSLDPQHQTLIVPRRSILLIRDRMKSRKHLLLSRWRYRFGLWLRRPLTNLG